MKVEILVKAKHINLLFWVPKQLYLAPKSTEHHTSGYVCYGNDLSRWNVQNVTKNCFLEVSSQKNWFVESSSQKTFEGFSKNADFSIWNLICRGAKMLLIASNCSETFSKVFRECFYTK